VCGEVLAQRDGVWEKREMGEDTVVKKITRGLRGRGSKRPLSSKHLTLNGEEDELLIM
jgi:hypothetical protein